MNEIEKAIIKKTKYEKYDNLLMKERALYHLKENAIINNKKLSSEEIQKRRDALRNEYFEKFNDMQFELSSLDSDLIDDTYEDEIKMETEITEEKRELKNRSLRKVLQGPEAFIILAATLVIGSIFGVSNYISKKNKLINSKTKTYSEELDDVVKGAIHQKYGNIDSSIHGDVYVDDKDASNTLVSYVNYNEISDYIESTENPDLALFLLYSNYGTVKTPTYDRITNRTCEGLEFEYKGTTLTGNFDDYIRLNGYSDYDEYRRNCYKELLNDSDDILDNITVKVKKLK